MAWRRREGARGTPVRGRAIVAWAAPASGPGRDRLAAWFDLPTDRAADRRRAPGAGRGYRRVAFGIPASEGLSPTFDMSGRGTLKMSPSGA